MAATATAATTSTAGLRGQTTQRGTTDHTHICVEQFNKRAGNPLAIRRRSSFESHHTANFDAVFAQHATDDDETHGIRLAQQILASANPRWWWIGAIKYRRAVILIVEERWQTCAPIADPRGIQPLMLNQALHVVQ